MEINVNEDQITETNTEEVVQTEQPVKVFEEMPFEEPSEPKPKVVNKTGIKYPFTELTVLNITDKDGVKPGLFLPTSNYDKIKEVETFYDKKVEDGTDIKTLVNETELASLLVAFQGSGNTTKDSVYSDTLNSDDTDFTNDIKYGDKELNLRHINFKQTTGIISGATAVARFTALMGVGEITQVPLWHSGFWITIRPPKSSDVINLEYELSKNIINLGRQTNTLVFSNSAVLFIKLVTEFILKHVTETSLKLTSDEDMLDYIDVRDLNLMVIGMITSMYPRSIPITKSCINSTIIEDDKPKCSFTVQGKLDPKKMIVKDNKRITKDMKEHMSNRTPNSVTTDAVKEYQRLLNLNNDDILKVTYNENEIVMTLQNPNLKNYIRNGELWINNIISSAEELFTESDTDLIKNSKVSDILKSVIFGIYNTYIAKLETNGVSVVDNETITSILDSISNNKDGYDVYIKTIKKYISSTTIALVATPNYECPECSKLQNEEDGPFKELVPLNIIESFFHLCVLRVQEYREKNIY